MNKQSNHENKNVRSSMRAGERMMRELRRHVSIEVSSATRRILKELHRQDAVLEVIAQELARRRGTHK